MEREVVAVRMSDSEQSKLDNGARMEGVSRSEFIRRAVAERVHQLHANHGRTPVIPSYVEDVLYQEGVFEPVDPEYEGFRLKIGGAA